MRRRPGRPLVIAAAAVTFLLNSACGELPADGGPGPVVATAANAPQETAPQAAAPPAGAGPDACEVLTAADVELILGRPVELVNDLHGCDYLTRSEPSTLVGVSVNPLAGGAEAFEELTAAAAAELPGGATWPVAGLGESAAAVSTAEDVQLYVQLPDAYLVFNVLHPSGDPDASLALLQRLALTAVTRLETPAGG